MNALAAPITAKERAENKLTNVAREKYESKAYRPKAQALVNQYVETVEALYAAVEGETRVGIPNQVRTTRNGNSLVFTSTTDWSWRARLNDDGSLKVIHNKTVTSFEFKSEGEVPRAALDRTIVSERAKGRFVRADRVNLYTGIREPIQRGFRA